MITNTEHLLLVFTDGKAVTLKIVKGYHGAMYGAEKWRDLVENGEAEVGLYTRPNMQIWHPDDDNRHTFSSFL